MTGLVLICGAVAVAQRPESSTSRLFPEPPRVLADYPDDPSRWAALTALYFAAGERGPDGQYKASYDKSSAYHLAIGRIEDAHHVGTPQADAAFVAKIQALRRDRAFTSQVLARYRLADLPTGTRVAPGAPPGAVSGVPAPPRANPEFEMQRSAPYWLATIVLMALVTQHIAAKPFSYPIPPAPTGTALSLPESLRVVEVPGVRYALESDSAIVVDEKTWTETTYSTYETQGSVQTVGDAVYVFPGRRESSVSTVVKDRLWLRDLAGHESTWVITGGVFSVRLGHVISRVGMRSDDAVDFIVACNHSTGQCVVFNAPIGRFHLPGQHGVWLIPTLVGVAGWVYGGWNLIPLLGQDSFILELISFTILGLIGSPIIALFVTTWVQTRIFRKRNDYFAQKYLPAIRQFLLKQSPAVIARFPATPATPARS
jgi:hypothetical protein